MLLSPSRVALGVGAFATICVHRWFILVYVDHADLPCDSSEAHERAHRRIPDRNFYLSIILHAV